MNLRRPVLSIDALRGAALCAALLGVLLPAAAQYKVVGPDGSITYTDRPPGNTAARVTPLGRTAITEVPAPDALPADLRQTATRYPVTLYGAANCEPCDAGRQLLIQRGVPYTEKRIVSDDDVAALERVVGVRSVPSLTIGAQALRGLSPTEWNAYLDAAGYPRESRLPKGWQASAATPMVERVPARAAAAAPAASAPAPPRVAPQALPQAPTGLRF